MLTRDREPHGTNQAVEVSLCMPQDLLHHHDAFLPRNLYREGRASTGAQRWLDRCNCLLDVLRIVIAAPKDDQIFQAACDIELAVALEAQIAGAYAPAIWASSATASSIS